MTLLDFRGEAEERQVLRHNLYKECFGSPAFHIRAKLTTMASLESWVIAARPKTLLVGISPVMVGTALALYHQTFHGLAAFCALMGTLLLQIGTNYANDYYDYQKGADTDQRLGPMRVTQAGLISPETLKKGMIFMFALAMVFSLYLMVRGGFPIVVIAIASVVFGILYSASKYALSYLGISDLFAFAFFGPVAVAGTYYVQALQFSLEAFWLGVSQGFFSMAILCVNNLRDVEQDRLANKKTLTVRLGKTFTRVQYSLCVIGGVMFPFMISLLNENFLLKFLSIFLVYMVIQPLRTIWKQEGKDLNPLLSGTAQLMFMQAIVLVLFFVS